MLCCVCCVVSSAEEQQQDEEGVMKRAWNMRAGESLCSGYDVIVFYRVALCRVVLSAREQQQKGWRRRWGRGVMRHGPKARNCALGMI